MINLTVRILLAEQELSMHSHSASKGRGLTYRSGVSAVDDAGCSVLFRALFVSRLPATRFVGVTVDSCIILQSLIFWALPPCLSLCSSVITVCAVETQNRAEVIQSVPYPTETPFQNYSPSGGARDSFEDRVGRAEGTRCADEIFIQSLAESLTK